MDEQLLIEKIREGDKQKLEELYIKYRKEFINWLISNYKVSVADAKDTYQQSVVLLYENIMNRKLETMNSKIKTYLFAIGKNLVHVQNRKAAKIIGISDMSGYDFQEEIQEDYTDKEGLIRLVKLAMTKLGEPCKNLLELHYYHQKSMEEISLALDYKNTSTTKNVKYKCLVRLRKIFQEELTLNRKEIYG